MTGSRRRYSQVKLPNGMCEAFNIPEEEGVLTIEHYDEGLSSSEVPFILALNDIKNQESKSK